MDYLKIRNRSIYLPIIIVALSLHSVSYAQKLEIVTQNGHFDTVPTIAISPDGKLLASGSNDKTIKLWDISSGKELRTLTGHTRAIFKVAFSPNGKMLVSASPESGVKLWDVTTGIELRSLISNPTFSVSFSPDGKTVASGGFDQTIKLWDISTAQVIRTLTGQNIVSSLAFSPDGKTLISGSLDSTVKLWDVTTGRELRSFKGHSDLITYITFSPDGKILASTSFDRTVKLWDVESGMELRTLTGHSALVIPIAFSSDSKLLASGGEKNIISVWQVASGRKLNTIESNAGHVTSLVFSPNNKLLASSGSNPTIELWDMSTSKLTLTLPGISTSTDNDQHRQGDWLVFTPEGLFDGSPSAWNNILWRYGVDLFDVAPVETFFNEYYTPGLFKELMEGKPLHSSVAITSKDRRQPEVRVRLAETPVHTQNIFTRTVKMQIEVTEMPPDKNYSSGSGARDVRLYRNGILIRAWPGELVLKNGRATLEATIPVVAGVNDFMAYAFNRDYIKSRAQSFTAIGDASLRRTSTTYILAVGIDQYNNPRFNTKFSAADARSFSAELAQQQQKLDPQGRTETTLLLDQAATKAHILQAIRQIANQAQPEDVIFIYFSGIGSSQQGHYYLIPHDFSFIGERSETNNKEVKTNIEQGISDNELSQAIEGMDAGHLIMIIDSSHSGKLLETRSLVQLAYDKGMYILTASQSNQQALEVSKLGHGYLTYALVEEGLKQGQAASQNGMVTLRSWLEYAAQRVPQSFAEGSTRAAPQTPQLFIPRQRNIQPLIIARIKKEGRDLTR